MIGPQPRPLSYPQQQQQRHPTRLHIIDEVLGCLLQQDVKDSEAHAAKQRLVQLFSSKLDPSNEPTPAHLEALVCLLYHSAPAAATAAADILSSICTNRAGTSIYLVQDGAVLTASACLLQDSNPSAQAATHLLLVLAGMGPEMHCEAPACHPDDFQRIMSHEGVVEGLVNQLTRGSGRAAAAAVLMLARHSVNDATAIVPQLMKHRAALSGVVALLAEEGPRINLADAAAQLLCTVAEAGCEKATAVAGADKAVVRLLRLVLDHSKQPQQGLQLAELAATTAAGKAACALCYIMSNADASICRRIAVDAGVVAALAAALQRTDNVVLQERALYVLQAAASQGNDRMCSLILSQSDLIDGLLHMLLPGGAHSLEAAQDAAITLAANVTGNQGAQLTVSLMTALTDTRLGAACSGTATQSGVSAAAEQAAWILTNLTGAKCDNGHEQLSLADAVAPLLRATSRDTEQRLSKLRSAVASKLGAVAGEVSGSLQAQEAAASALCMLVQSVDAKERLTMASCADVVCGLARHVELSSRHGCASPTNCASACQTGSEAATSALLKLAADSKLQLAASAVPASMHACKEALVQTWLAANSGALQHAAAGGWGSLSVVQLAATARKASHLQEHERKKQHEPGNPQGRPCQEGQSQQKQGDQRQPQTSVKHESKAKSAPGRGEPHAGGRVQRNWKQQLLSHLPPPPTFLQPLKKETSACKTEKQEASAGKAVKVESSAEKAIKQETTAGKAVKQEATAGQALPASQPGDASASRAA